MGLTHCQHANGINFADGRRKASILRGFSFYTCTLTLARVTQTCAKLARTAQPDRTRASALLRHAQTRSDTARHAQTRINTLAPVDAHAKCVLEYNCASAAARATRVLGRKRPAQLCFCNAFDRSGGVNRATYCTVRAGAAPGIQTAAGRDGQGERGDRPRLSRADIWAGAGGCRLGAYVAHIIGRTLDCRGSTETCRK